MNKFFDLHVHTTPDIIDRKYTPINLCKELKLSNSGAVLKSHIYNTIGLSASLHEQGYNIYGSLVLNKYTGGVNIDIVKAAIASRYKNEPFILYFPTFSSKKWTFNVQKNSFNIFENHIALETISSHGKLKKSVIEILKIAAYYNCPIATGHSNKNEVLLLCEEVEKIKGRILLTHPYHPLIGFAPIELKNILTSPNIYMEITLLMLLNNKQSFQDCLHLLSICNNNNICLSSDLGQLNNINVSAAYQWFSEQLKNKTNTINNINQLIYKISWLNPIKYLGV